VIHYLGAHHGNALHLMRVHYWFEMIVCMVVEWARLWYFGKKQAIYYVRVMGNNSA
jgi:hypothetical protein